MAATCRATRIMTAAVHGQRAASLRPAAKSGAFRAAALRQRAPRRHVAAAASAMIPEWTDPEFTDMVMDSFPEKAIATVEEARCLIEKAGYVYLDVRPELERDAVGKAKGSINIPICNAKWVWNAEEGKKKMQKEDNELFIQQVEKRFPDKETYLIIGCSDGLTYSIDALEMLDEAGYYNLVGLRGGFNSWFRVFDNKGGRRRSGEYAESYNHDGDSCGIHSSGAGFDRVDAIEKWVPPTY
ncbi:hypothetical protein D9Q98_007337 [Chlorella vulgaris]|uniref:Rhodanese domain-containing protein n=1 Tax=Chlorella vulgaris TaxID=3077 RepID=A0A9D4TL18_CHLVU|nr:hypothetical protein D9Q98_007337 [Chlorella vulgaris]